MSKPGKSLKGLCKKLGVRLTLKKGKKRVYKSIKVLKEQCKRKVIKKKKVKKKKVRKRKVKRKRRKFGSGIPRGTYESLANKLLDQKTGRKYKIEDDKCVPCKDRGLNKNLLAYIKNEISMKRKLLQNKDTTSSMKIKLKEEIKELKKEYHKLLRGDENCVFFSRKECNDYKNTGEFQCSILMTRFSPNENIFLCPHCGIPMSEAGFQGLMESGFTRCATCRKPFDDGVNKPHIIKAKRYYDYIFINSEERDETNNPRTSFKATADTLDTFKDEYGKFEEDIFGERKEGPFKDMQKRAKRQDFLQFKLNSKEHLGYEEKLKQKELKKEYDEWKKFVEDKIKKSRERALKARDEREKKREKERRIEKIRPGLMREARNAAARRDRMARRSLDFGKKKRKRKMKRKRKPVKKKRKPVKKKRKPVKRKRKPVKKKRKPVKKKRKIIKRK